ncbi:type II toxin-antitoxin system VapC family toxin [Mariniphaga sp.]|jgi:PIN domain nuclease of toxin-antitoxin system|uniref:type II toxin-antitoxin system VapC family toxin n=1 Tax=Mariniphaga sp. TaxID=1954475 RepID=UPI003566F0B5
MELLIDTHTVIWFITEDKKLPTNTKRIIEDVDNKCYVSIATYWEIAIKQSLGRLDLNSDLEKIFRIIEETGFEVLPITVKQILENAKLDFHHQDPFDRIIIAQAIHENLSIVTKDSQFRKYKIPLVWEK